MRMTENINVHSIVPLVSPRIIKEKHPITEHAVETVVNGREAIKQILGGVSNRLLIVAGPCSIHEEKSALEYAEKLLALSKQVHDRVFLVMRVYFEKPRTTIGWKGLINDPNLDGTFDIETGLHRSRALLLQLAEMGVPAGTEMLDPITPQYIADLVTWASLGARTTESQTHRQMASGLSMSVGYKNATDGNLQIALDALEAARNPHSFLGIDFDGMTCIVNTTGNPWGHLILRGGRSGPNYQAPHVDAAAESMVARGLSPIIMVDCSHSNSAKDHRKQEEVFKDVIDQRWVRGNDNIIGLMLESHLFEGSQKLTPDLTKLRYGVSITDACLGWEKTEELVLHAYGVLGTMRPGRPA